MYDEHILVYSDNRVLVSIVITHLAKILRESDLILPYICWLYLIIYCLSACLSVCMCSWVCTNVEARGGCYISSSVTLQLFLWERVSHRTWSSLTWQDQLVSKIQRPTYPACPVLELQMHATASVTWVLGSKVTHLSSRNFTNRTLSQPHVLALSKTLQVPHLWSQAHCNEGKSVGVHFYESPNGSDHGWSIPGELAAEVWFHAQAGDGLDQRRSDHSQIRCDHGSE